MIIFLIFLIFLIYPSQTHKTHTYYQFPVSYHLFYVSYHLYPSQILPFYSHLFCLKSSLPRPPPHPEVKRARDRLYVRQKNFELVSEHIRTKEQAIIDIREAKEKVEFEAREKKERWEEWKRENTPQKVKKAYKYIGYIRYIRYPVNNTIQYNTIHNTNNFSLTFRGIGVRKEREAYSGAPKGTDP